MSKRSYRKQIVHTWNEIAPRYHRRVKAGGPGPFESTGKMLSMSGISKGWRVLDVACGTGAVAQQLLRRTGNGGLVVGIDASHTALLLAKKYVRGANFHPVICDAENMRFSGKPFDAATCQFGLFFFADAQKALKNIRRSLKSRGVLAMVPYTDVDTPFYELYSIKYAVAQSISRARSCGVLSPLVYFMDTKECSITIQYIDGILVRDLSGIKFDNACRKIGSMAATLHKNGIMHGDMTTSNFLLGKKGMYMIDFGLSISTIKIDDLAVDLRLFKEALSSAHSKRLKSAWNAFLSGYKKTTAEKKTYEKILERVAIIEGRGRYATVV